MSGWSGVALAGLGAGIGKSLEPENLAKIADNVDNFKWQEDKNKLLADADKEFDDLYNSYSTPTNQKQNTQSYNVNLSNKSFDVSELGKVNTNIDVNKSFNENEMGKSGLNNLNGVNISTDSAPQQEIKYKPSKELKNYFLQKKLFELASSGNNVQRIQQQAAMLQQAENNFKESLASQAIQATVSSNPKEFQNVLINFYTSRGERVPDIFSGIPQISTVRSSNGQVDTVLRWKNKGEIYLSDLNDFLRGDLGRLTSVQSARGVGSGAGSSGKSNSPLVITAADNGEIVDGTQNVLNVTRQVEFNLRRFVPSGVKNEKGEVVSATNFDKVRTVFNTFDDFIRTNNGNVITMLANSKLQENPNDLDNVMLHSYFQPLEVNQDDMNSSSKDTYSKYIKTYYVKVDGNYVSKDFLDVFGMARDYVEIAQKRQAQQQDAEKRGEKQPDTLSDIRKTDWYKRKPFPTGNNREALISERAKWAESLMTNITTRTDINVSDPIQRFQIVNALIELEMEDAEKKQSQQGTSLVDVGSNLLFGSTKDYLTSAANYMLDKGVKVTEKPEDKPNNNSNDFSNTAISKTGITRGAYGENIINNNDLRPVEPTRNYGQRADGTDKGAGWLGPFRNNKEQDVTEFTIGVPINGKEMDIPTLVPGLTQGEIKSVIKSSQDGSPLPQSVIDKAINHATGLVNSGQSVFAPEGYFRKYRPQPGIGSKPNTLSVINNNPGNLTFVGQRGATEGKNGFGLWQTAEDGWNALKKQINLDVSRNFTLAGFINKYAPPKENDTNNYINFVSKNTGINPNQKITKNDTEKIAAAITYIEGGKKSYDYFASQIPELNNYSFGSKRKGNVSSSLGGIPIAMVGSNMPLSMANNLSMNFADTQNAVEGAYKQLKKSLSFPKSGPTPKTTADASSSIFASLSKSDMKTPTLTAAFATLKLLPPPERFLTLAFIHKVLPDSLTLRDYTRSILRESDVNKIVKVINHKAKNVNGGRGYTGADGGLFGQVGLSDKEANNASFSIGGFSFKVLSRDKEGKVTSFEYIDSYDYYNKQRKERIEKFKQNEKAFGFWNAFKMNFVEAIQREEIKDKTLYKGSNVQTSSAKEFFSRAFGETIFNDSETAPKFKSKINIVYNPDGSLKDYRFEQLKKKTGK